MKMPCLSLWQPWASLIGRGKSLETRGWKTDYRGPLAIHAAKKWTPDLIEIAMSEPFCSALKRGGIETLQPWPLGAIVAVTRLVDIVSTDYIERVVGEINPFAIQITSEEYAFGNYSPGRFAWFLDSIQILERPIPMRGHQGLFQVDLPEREVRP